MLEVYPPVVNISILSLYQSINSISRQLSIYLIYLPRITLSIYLPGEVGDVTETLDGDILTFYYLSIYTESYYLSIYLPGEVGAVTETLAGDITPDVLAAHDKGEHGPNK